MSDVRTPPCDVDTERLLLGAVLVNPQRATTVAALPPEVFYRPAHAHIAGAIGQLHGAGHPTDVGTVAAHLRERGLLDAVGGFPALSESMNDTPTTDPASVERWAQILIRLHHHRALIALAGELADAAYAQIDPGDIIARIRDVTLPSEHPAEGDDLSSWIEPICWPDLFAAELRTQDWIIEPVVPAGRQVSTYSGPKIGKSLLTLDGCAAAATGGSVFGSSPKDPVDIVYIDPEMTRDDLRERLEDMGYGPDSDLSRLHYYQLTSLPPLDTELGGQVLEAVVKRCNARLVVLDTMARVVRGDEDVADTYRNFYRYTGQRLKGLGVALWRLDHAGKDPERGQRGSSEKAGDVDVVFRLTTTDDTVILKRTHSRVPWVPPEVVLQRQHDPVLSHLLKPEAVPPVVISIITELDRIGVPPDTSANSAARALRDAGIGRRKQDVVTAVKVRRTRS